MSEKKAKINFDKVRVPEELMAALRQKTSEYNARNKVAPSHGSMLLEAWRTYSMARMQAPLVSSKVKSDSTDDIPLPVFKDIPGLSGSVTVGLRTAADLLSVSNATLAAVLRLETLFNVESQSDQAETGKTPEEAVQFHAAEIQRLSLAINRHERRMRQILAANSEKHGAGHGQDKGASPKSRRRA